MPATAPSSRGPGYKQRADSDGSFLIPTHKGGKQDEKEVDRFPGRPCSGRSRSHDGGRPGPGGGVVPQPHPERGEHCRKHCRRPGRLGHHGDPSPLGRHRRGRAAGSRRGRASDSGDAGVCHPGRQCRCGGGQSRRRGRPAGRHTHRQRPVLCSQRSAEPSVWAGDGRSVGPAASGRSGP